MKKHSQKCIAIIFGLMILSACSSSPKKEEAPVPASTTPTSPETAIQIPTSSKDLTPVVVPNDTAVDSGKSEAGPSITLKPAPGSAGKVASEQTQGKSEPAPQVKVTKPKIQGVDPETSLRWLQNGNTRFTKGFLRKDGQSKKDVQRLINLHRPHAIVLASSDGRVPPEIVFDQKLGEIFTIRTLGPSLSPEVVASIEYAMIHLGARNVVVLGHSSCGGAKLAYVTMQGHDAGSENLKELAADIQPRIQTVVEGKAPSKDFIQECWANTKGVAEDLKTRSTVIREALQGQTLKISSALYDLTTGRVEFAK